MPAIQLNVLYVTPNDCILHNWSETDFNLHDWNAIDYIVHTYTSIADIEFSAHNNYIVSYSIYLKCI